MDSTILSKVHPTISFRNCPEGCRIFLDRKMGTSGPFYVCHRCKNTISEHSKGDIDQPCGVCSICKGLLFWRSLPDGTRFKACWSPQLHSKIIKK